jgi:type I restriction enzyme M protein
MVNKLNDKGVAAFILANGSLSTSNKLELEIRKKMLEKDIVECIIALPSNLFYTTAIPASI